MFFVSLAAFQNKVRVKRNLDKGPSARWFSSQILANLQEIDNSHFSHTILEHRKGWDSPS